MHGVDPIDPDGLSEYSVVFTERSLNHMSRRFQQVMRDISSTLRTTYNAAAVVVVPGGGTYGMEAIARQFAADRRCLVIRNGYFSYRWSQILETGRIASDVHVLQATPLDSGSRQPFTPPALDTVVATIREVRPDVVFAPHVDTSSGMLLPDAYLRAVGEAVHESGGLFVLDCVASGAVRVDMKASGVDVLLTAPQKGWSASPCAGLVMLGDDAAERIRDTRSTSFACDLLRWLQIMQAYEKGGHAYHATLPTDALLRFRDAMLETVAFGLDEAERRQWELGRRIRAMLADAGFPSVAAHGYEAPGVVVCYTDEPAVQNGSRFADAGIQIAAGVPLMCDEPPDFRTFRIGLFGLDKWQDVDGTVLRLERAVRTLQPAGTQAFTRGDRPMQPDRFTMVALAAATLVSPVAAQQAVRPEDTEVWQPVPPVVAPGGSIAGAAPPSDAIVLFDGTSLDEWVGSPDGGPAGWTVADGAMTVVKSAGNIETRRRFLDFQLHLEFRIPEGITGEGQARGNSGVYLAFTAEGGYELQVLDSYGNETYVNGMAGAVYKQSIPLANASRPPGEWQTWDIVWTAPRFRADATLESPARVTAFFNGVLVQHDFELRGFTVYTGRPEYHAHGDAPIMLQAHGDPSPPISFRNVWVRPLAGPPG